MNANSIESRFAEMGARVKVITDPSITRGFTIDIQRDTKGEFFELQVPEHPSNGLNVSVAQIEPKDRHLLLMVRREMPKKHLDRYLCGHDERSWFVAAVPGGASSVAQAKEALKPELVRTAEAAGQLTARQRNTRNNRAFRRQGEWFFLPMPHLAVDPKLVLKNEPISRGNGGKPHIVEQLFRTGGTTVYVSFKHPKGLKEPEYRRYLLKYPQAAQWQWRIMKREPVVYARGTVRHSDHAPVTLSEWHRVLMNTENQSRSMRNMTFLD